MKNGETANRSRPARGALKERQRAERAELILDAAEEVFAEKGYHDAAIEEIAARVGISKGAIYLHFASKEALLEAWFARQIARFLAMVDDATAEATTVRERLERILDWCYRRMSGEDRAVLLELGSIGLANSVINQRPALLASAARATERITALLDEGKRTGELVASVPTPILVAVFGGLLTAGFEQLLVSGQYQPTELVAYVSRSFFERLAIPSVSDG